MGASPNRAGYTLLELLLVLSLLSMALVVGGFFLGKERTASLERNAKAYGKVLAAALEQDYLSAMMASSGNSAAILSKESFLGRVFTSSGFMPGTRACTPLDTSSFPLQALKGLNPPKGVECAVGVKTSGGILGIETFVVYTRRVGGGRVYSSEKP